MRRTAHATRRIKHAQKYVVKEQLQFWSFSDWLAALLTAGLKPSHHLTSVPTHSSGT